MRGGDPKATFWLSLPVEYNDGSMRYPGADGHSSFDRRDLALANMKRDVKAYGGRVVVYECKPIESLELIMGEPGEDEDE